MAPKRRTNKLSNKLWEFYKVVLLQNGAWCHTACCWRCTGATMRCARTKRTVRGTCGARSCQLLPASSALSTNINFLHTLNHSFLQDMYDASAARSADRHVANAVVYTSCSDVLRSACSCAGAFARSGGWRAVHSIGNAALAVGCASAAGPYASMAWVPSSSTRAEQPAGQPANSQSASQPAAVIGMGGRLP